MVIGPTDWLASAKAASILKLDMTPLEVRKEVARFLRASGIPVVVMEEEKQGEGETNFKFFLRLLKENNVKTFVVVWPLGTKLHGFSVEAGYILSQISTDAMSPDQVFLLIEQGVVELDEQNSNGAVLSINEKGNGSHYYGDLPDENCPMFIWETMEQLKWNAINIVVAHRKAYEAVVPPIREHAGETATEKS